MDKTVPAGAAYLLNFIGGIEAPRGYDTIYGNNQGKLPKPVTKMTLKEVQASQQGWTKKFGSSATGRYQFMYKTLKELINELGLSLSQNLDANLQDRLAYHLLRSRGYDAFVFGRIDHEEFAKRLAMEWASLPVLKNTRGAHRNIVSGQSYYAGDGVNKSLVAPELVFATLVKVRKLHQAQPAAPQVKPSNAPAVATAAATAGATAVAVATEAPSITKGITDAAEAVKPVGEALTGLAGVPGPLLIGLVVLVLIGAAWWIIKQRAKDDDK